MLLLFWQAMGTPFPWATGQVGKVLTWIGAQIPARNGNRDTDPSDPGKGRGVEVEVPVGKAEEVAALSDGFLDAMSLAGEISANSRENLRSLLGWYPAWGPPPSLPVGALGCPGGFAEQLRTRSARRNARRIRILSVDPAGGALSAVPRGPRSAVPLSFRDG